MKCTRSLSLLILIFISSCIPPSEKVDRTQHLSQIDRIIQTELEQGNIPGAVVLVGQANRVLYHKALGHAQLEPIRQKMSLDTRFDLASLTKPVVTAPCMLILMDQGKLSLTDPVSLYLPAYASHGKAETQLKHLLTHTSGLPAYTNAETLEQAWGPVCPERVIDKICGFQASNAPGEVFRYSCLGYIVAARIVEIVSGKSIAEFSQEFLFKPLGMTQTGYQPHASATHPIAATEISDQKLHLGRVHDPLAQCMGGVSGNAGLFTTAHDLSIYCRMLLNGGLWQGRHILSPKAITVLTTEQSKGRACGFDLSSQYAWIKGSHAHPSAYCHSGYTGTSLVCDPVSRRYAIILTNRVHPRDDGSCKTLRKAIADVVFSEQKPSEH